MRLTLPFGLSFAALSLLLGCNDAAVITRVARTPMMTPGTFTSMGLGEGMATEIHGAPFPGATAQKIAQSLRAPGGMAREIHFRSVAPGSASYDAPNRLVLVFNGIETPDATRDCRRKEPAPTAAPTGEGFGVMASLCHGEKWIGAGHLRVSRMKTGDWTGFSDAMAGLFQAMLKRDPDDR